MRSVVVKYEERKNGQIESHIVGELNFVKGKWVFQYSKDWQETFKMELDFDLRFDCVNESPELFPFFFK